MRLKIAFAAMLIASPLQAGQPISESLVDCATLYDTSNRAFPERRNTEKGQKLSHAHDQLLVAAQKQATREGRKQPETYVSGLVAAKEEKWDSRGLSYVFTQEFRDWMKYCRSLSNHLGLELVE